MLNSLPNNSTPLNTSPLASKTSFWIFGEEFHTASDLNKLTENILYFSYRQNFLPILSSAPVTSDAGWGCMYRVGQMLLANVLWRLRLAKNSKAAMWETLRDFADVPHAPFSIHALVQQATGAHQKSLPTWLGPHSVAQALAKLVRTHVAKELQMYVAADRTIDFTVLDAFKTDAEWKPLLIVVPVLSGLDIYMPARYTKHLLALCRLPQFRGILGGRPHSSFYFIGYCEDGLLYLDPHMVQSFVDLSLSSAPLNSYRTSNIFCLPLSNLDPCLGIAFFCLSSAELDSLQNLMQQITADISEEDRVIHLTMSTPQQNTGDNDAFEITPFDFE
jgi:cysteine protease ATG4